MRPFFWTLLFTMSVLAVNANNSKPLVRMSLQNILESSPQRVKRSSNLRHNNDSGQSMAHLQRHHNRNIHHMLDVLSTAENTTEPGYATIIKEEGKVPRFVCPAGEWACPIPHDRLVKCIPITNVCDYAIDCPGAEDEDPMQCAHSKARELQTQILEECSRVNERLSNLEKGYIQQSCQLSNVKALVENHEHTGRHQVVSFRGGHQCPNYGFSYSLFNSDILNSGDSS